MKRRVVVTGVGAVSPLGNCVIEMWRNAKMCIRDRLNRESSHKIAEKRYRKLRNMGKINSKRKADMG